MSPSLKAKSEAIAPREEKDNNKTNTIFFMLLNRRKDPAYQFGCHVGRDNLIAVTLKSQILLE